MSVPRTPEQMAHEINDLNCHGSQSTHNPVTVAQMEAIYAEARKMEWTDKAPHKTGKWWYRNKLDRGWGKPHIVTVREHCGEMGVGRNGVLPCCLIKGQWSTRPIDMPSEKEDSKL